VIGVVQNWLKTQPKTGFNKSCEMATIKLRWITLQSNIGFILYIYNKCAFFKKKFPLLFDLPCILMTDSYFNFNNNCTFLCPLTTVSQAIGEPRPFLLIEKAP
jgi:hypothetical protein